MTNNDKSFSIEIYVKNVITKNYNHILFVKHIQVNFYNPLHIYYNICYQRYNITIRLINITFIFLLKMVSIYVCIFYEAF